MTEVTQASQVYSEQSAEAMPRRESGEVDSNSARDAKRRYAKPAIVATLTYGVFALF